MLFFLNRVLSLHIHKYLHFIDEHSLFFSQAHVDLGFIGSSDTEGTALEIADEGQSMEEVQSSSLAMWETEVQRIELEKGSVGLGFSILDYQVTSALLRTKYFVLFVSHNMI